MEEISKIVKEAYKIFSVYRPKKHILLDGMESPMRLINTSSLLIGNIPLELLREYNSSGDYENLNELKYFAPRYLDFVKDNEFPCYYDGILSLKIFSYFNESDWTIEEKELLNRYALTVFKNYLKSNWEKPLLPHEILLMFYKGNFNINKLLKEWESTGEQKSLVLFKLLLDEIEYTKSGRLKVQDAFSDEKFNTQICNWVRSKSVKLIFGERIQEALKNPSENFTKEYWEELSWRFEMMI